jgi:hypothetical protein
MADKSLTSTNASIPARTACIKIEEEWFDDDANRPIEDKKIKLKTIQRGFQMNNVEFAALRAEFTQHIINATDSHNTFRRDSSQEDLQEALRKINIRPQKDAVTRRRALIPPGWRNIACFALLCQGMIEWRDAEVTNRDNSRSVNAHTFPTQTGTY